MRVWLTPMGTGACITFPTGGACSSSAANVIAGGMASSQDCVAVNGVKRRVVFGVLPDGADDVTAVGGPGGPRPVTLRGNGYSFAMPHAPASAWAQRIAWRDAAGVRHTRGIPANAPEAYTPCP